MQYGRDLERLIRDFFISNPALGPMHILKTAAGDGLYRIGLLPMDDPKLGLVSPSEVEDEELLAIPLTLPMGWKTCHLFFARRQRQWRVYQMQP